MFQPGLGQKTGASWWQFQLTLEERRLDAADILKRISEEDQHGGVDHLSLVFCMGFIIIVTNVSTGIFHFEQYVTKASEDTRAHRYYSLQFNVLIYLSLLPALPQKQAQGGAQ